MAVFNFVLFTIRGIGSAVCVFLGTLFGDSLDLYQLRVLQLSPAHGSASKRQTKRKKNEDLTKVVLQSIQDHFKRPTYQDDRYDIIGKMVALKLRDFKNKQQQLLAEKIINETLFEAEMGNLTMPHRPIKFSFEEKKKLLLSSLQKKWKSLRDNYMGEVKKMKTVKSGSGASKISSYIHYNRLRFLQPSIADKDTENSFFSASSASSEVAEVE
ncbi:unnamed protein product [Leptidea sinapis]|uniref:MADF domain-containing protein n=1 Tax=Leptidea sinapis TaxID=189913 RepID=A0A5E4QF61_9NEOP|nr:unnamed protein product [Leptidea sinapis]